MTVLDALVRRVRKAAEHNRGAEEPPAVVLWPDRDRQWEPLLPALRASMPELYCFGAYAPDQRCGPAIWLRCVLGKAVPHATHGDAVPVLYLPGVGRSDLRAVETCPEHLQPLAELQYRGSFFGHSNGKDWTVPAFLASPRDGLGLDLAEDQGTANALRQVLRRLANVPVAELRGRRLEASDFHDLLSPDFDRHLLRWINTPEAVRAEFEDAEWAAFCDRVVKRYGFHPEADGVLAGADRLVKPEGAWKSVWARFEESAPSYPVVAERLTKVDPSLLHPQTSPRLAAANEDALRGALLALGSLTQPKAAAGLRKLDMEHGARRSYVWARLGRTPLVAALEHLAALAEFVAAGPGGGTPGDLAARYEEGGWRADGAAIRALAQVGGKDAEAVHAAIVAVYRPWLEDQASALAAAVAKHGYPRPPPLAAPAEGECILFADGLRLDVGRSLVEALAESGLKPTTNTRWVAFPPVTPTAKPAVSPVAHLLADTSWNEEFRPSIRATGKLVTHDLFKKLLADSGVQFLDPTDTGDPQGRAWTEFGDIDTYGHQHGWKTARHIEGQVRDLVRRVHELFAAGWQRVRVVTDHGWLLLPGGLPKRELHASLTNTRWRRCATLAKGVLPTVPTVPWHWNKDVEIAIAPDIGVFVDGADYSHGGLTVQECVVPVITVDAPEAKVSVAIESVKWVRGQCKVVIKGAVPGLQVDVRVKAGDPATSVAIDKEARGVGANGAASVPVEDGADGTMAWLVVIDANGTVLHKQATPVGGEL